MKHYHYVIATEFGFVGLFWEGADQPRLLRIILAGKEEKVIARACEGGIPISPDQKEQLQVGRVEACLAGRGNEAFPDFSGRDLSEFQQRVLLECWRIPRGRVSSYGTLAARAGCPDGARAVGGVMAANPLPLLIPCHRVVRSDGRLGDFGGGIEMKRTLLQREGIELDAAGRVPERYFLRVQ
ncbi:MAG: MGMT family protein [Smithellaceae bacterium]|nr:MGMT family protein [Smithellaceae bacterium]